jgi:proton glutamate symport protein
MAIGFSLGLIFQKYYSSQPSGIVYIIITSAGDIFIRLLRMVIVPLVFASIVSGVSGIGSGKQLGRLGLKTFIYYLSTSLVAIIIGLLLTNTFLPGKGVILADTHTPSPELEKPASILELLIQIIPLNPVNAAANDNMLSIIFFSILLGIVITKIKKEHSDYLRNFFQAFFEAVMKLTEMIIKFIPIGIIGLITKAVATSGIELFSAIGKFMIIVAAGLAIHMLVILPSIFYLCTRINILKHYQAVSSAMITAFSTSSSNATLPVTLRSVEKNIGVSNRISSFIIPMGATINMDGTALYECSVVLFMCQVLHYDLAFTQQLIVVFTALLASVGTAAIPSASLVTIFIITNALGLHDHNVGMIIGLILAIDRPLDMFRTMVNVTSDTIGTVIIAKSEGESKLYQSKNDAM